MGKLTYGPGSKELNVDDRALAHVQAVIIAKLRRGESFAFTWQRPAEEGSGHVTVWMHPAISIEFEFQGSRHITLNRAWIDALMDTVNSVNGFALVPEPQPGNGR